MSQQPSLSNVDAGALQPTGGGSGLPPTQQIHAHLLSALDVYLQIAGRNRRGKRDLTSIRDCGDRLKNALVNGGPEFDHDDDPHGLVSTTLHKLFVQSPLKEHRSKYDGKLETAKPSNGAIFAVIAAFHVAGFQYVFELTRLDTIRQKVNTWALRLEGLRYVVGDHTFTEGTDSLAKTLITFAQDQQREPAE